MNRLIHPVSENAVAFHLLVAIEKTLRDHLNALFAAT
jgi:hypothetical protein